MQSKVIAIVGPTASGKTGIGVRLAKKFNGEIVSADSRQVFCGLDLGTGKEGEHGQKKLSITNYQLPINSQLKNDQWKINENWKMKIENLRSNLRYIDGIPQWVIDVVEPGQKFTLFDYLPQARVAIDDILSRGKLPIIVGGTGLYVQGLVEGFGLSQKSKIKSQKLKLKIKNYSRTELSEMPINKLIEILQECDVEKSQKVDQKNRHRLIRAIELAQDGLVPTKIKPDFEVLQIGLDLPRQELHKRIDRRVDERFAAGMLEEVVGLINSGVDPDWLQGLGLEYREITNYLLESGIRNQESCKKQAQKKSHNSVFSIHNSEFESMRQRLKYKIHQFARRQLTWFRRFPEINWLSDYSEIERFTKIFLEH